MSSCFFLFLFFSLELVPLCPVFTKKNSSVTQDDLDKAGHIRLFGVVVGEKGVLLPRESNKRKKNIVVSDKKKMEERKKVFLPRVPYTAMSYADDELIAVK